MSFKDIIDLRSDTVTKPSKEMREAMFSAEVGDDVFSEDPTVNKLENKVAEMFGKDSAIFCPSGTMTNQIGIKLLTSPQEEIICDKGAHVYYYEGGGIAFNSGLSIRLIDGDRGRINPAQVLENINPSQNYHQPRTTLVSVENTSNKGGGSVYKFEDLQAISDVCKKNDLKLHLDGARLFNAITESGDSLIETGKLFDTISICLSKGLGAPVGSVLTFSKEHADKAKRIRKVFGGGMRQAGFLAAAGLYALENNIKLLKSDHIRAQVITKTLSELSFVKSISPVETNIIIFSLNDDKPVQDFINFLLSNNIKGYQFGRQTVRLVTHLDFTDDMLEHVVTTLKKY